MVEVNPSNSESMALLTIALPLLGSLPRLTAVFVLLPLFGQRTVRGIVRNEFIVVLALFIWPLAAATTPEQGFVPLAFAMTTLKEALIGVVLGFFLGTVFWVAENLGYLVDLQTGTDNAAVFEPLREHEEGPTATFMLQFVVGLVLAGGGLLTLLEVVFESYRVWPIHALLPDWGEAFRGAVSARADSLLAHTLRFAAPVIVLLLLVELGLGLINRFADQLDVYRLAMPLKSLVAFFVLWVFASFIYESVRGLLHFDVGLLRALGGASVGR